MSAAQIPVEFQPDLPATPLSLLALSETFETYGYTKLARHLRAAADQLAAQPHREVHAILDAASYEQHVGGSRYGVVLKGSDAAVHDVRLGQRYALVPVPMEPLPPRPLGPPSPFWPPPEATMHGPSMLDDDRR